MIDEDRTAAKLKGYNVMVKFRDGEELFLKVDIKDDQEWFLDVESYINGAQDVAFPSRELAVRADTIKYVLKI